jgi:ferredoxin/nitrate reductase gamma subunit
MSHRADPDLLFELKKYGAVNIESCFNCGTCTAICPLTSDEHPFPRNMIRLVQLGLKDRLMESTDPWLCYYCGECTETCPREAEPAETMMSLRRWLTAQYDPSGHAAKLYLSEKAVVMTIIRAALLTLVFIVVLHLLGIATVVTDQVELNAFAPVLWVWAFVLLHFAYLGVKVIRNTLYMSKLVMRASVKDGKIPISVYISEIKILVINLVTQKRWRDCGGENRWWFRHLLLLSGYATMLILVVVLLPLFQTDNIYPIYNPQRWLGYYATIVLIYISVDMLIFRRRKEDEMHRFSQPSDWLFPMFLLVGAVTGIMVNIFRYLGADNAVWAWPTYIIYLIHVMAMIAMLDTEVGIGKWMHLIYRPWAMYLDAVKAKAAEKESAAGALAPAD